MGFVQRVMSGFRQLNVVDIGIFKLCMVAFTLLIAKLIPQVLDLGWYWYALVFAVSYAWILTRTLQKQSNSP